MGEQVKYVVWLNDSYAEDFVADKGFSIADGFITFYINGKFYKAYNVDRILKIEIE